MAKSEQGFATVGVMVGLGVFGYLGLKYGPAVLKSLTASGSASPSGGGGSSITNLLNPLNPRGTPVPIQRPSPTLPKSGSGGGSKGGGGGSGAGSNNNNGSKTSSSSQLPGTMSISQALAQGLYTGANQSVLAGIFNIQQGAGDFAGDSRQSIAQQWLDGGMGLTSLDSSLPSSIGREQSLETLNMSGTDLGDGSTYYGGDTGDTSWLDGLFGIDPSSSYGPYDPSQSTEQTDVGGSDYGPTNGSYSYGGGDTGSGGDTSGTSGGGVSDYGPVDPGYGGDTGGGVDYSGTGGGGSDGVDPTQADGGVDDSGGVYTDEN